MMCIAGIIIGVRSYLVIYRKKKKWKTPYKKPVYKWHHILGFIFGIFVFTFAFSGMMSLAEVPQWMVKVHNPDIQRTVLAPEPVVLQSYKLDYRQILHAFPHQVKSIEWASFGKTPLYKAVIGNEMYFFNAENHELTKLYVSKNMIKRKLSTIHTEPVAIHLIREYDNYYINRERTLLLPVYKVDVADADHSTYYIQPENGSIRYYNTNTKVRRWTYQVLHSFELGFLVKHPILWNILMWVTMIGGTLVSVTGVRLGFRYIRKKFGKKQNK
jgi:amino acid transporter